jgi:hypothetical protein
MSFDFDKLIKDSMTSDTLANPTLLEHEQQKICCFCNLNNNFEIDFNQFANYSLIIVNGSWERNNIFGECYQYVQEHSKNFIVLSYRIEDHLVLPNVFYFPYYGYQLRVNLKKVNRPVTDINKKSYALSCLNGNPRSHRIYNYFLLRHHKNFDNFYFTMHQDSKYDLVPDDDPVLALSPEHVQEWRELKSQFSDWNNRELLLCQPILHDQYTISKLGADIYNPAYTDSYINLVTETVVDHHVFITEKTWKAVAAGQLFLIIGYQGIISDLKKLGIDTFNDIIDHDYYDHEPDWKMRILKMHEVLNTLLEQDLEKINQQTLHRRKLNQEKFINGDFFQPYLTDINSCINLPN